MLDDFLVIYMYKMCTRIENSTLYSAGCVCGVLFVGVSDVWRRVESQEK